MTRKTGGEHGVALILALMVMVVMSALGSALMLAATTESRIARNFRNNAEGFYAADAVLEYSMGELQSTGDWTAVLGGGVRSAFADGSPHGLRRLADGTTIDLDGLVNDANCRRRTTCSDAAMDAITSERPWGPDNPRWQLFAWGALNDIASPRAIDSAFYVVAMVADDPSECDDAPLVDGGTMLSCPPGATENPGTSVLMLRGEAFGPFGSHKVIELSITRAKNGDGDEQPREAVDTGSDSTLSYNVVSQAGVRILSWRELKQP
jgi:hypothetical protein